MSAKQITGLHSSLVTENMARTIYHKCGLKLPPELSMARRGVNARYYYSRALNLDNSKRPYNSYDPSGFPKENWAQEVDEILAVLKSEKVILEIESIKDKVIFLLNNTYITNEQFTSLVNAVNALPNNKTKDEIFTCAREELSKLKTYIVAHGGAFGIEYKSNDLERAYLSGDGPMLMKIDDRITELDKHIQPSSA